MKSTWTKIPAMIGMAISIISFGFMIASLIASLTVPPVDRGYHPSFAFWIFGGIVAMISLIFYMVDAVLSITKVILKIHPVFNTILSIALIVAIPMMIFVGATVGFTVYVWNAYYLGVFILEIVSIVKHIKLNKQNNPT